MNERELDQHCHAIIAHVSFIRDQGPALIANYRDHGPDGFSSMGGEKVGGGEPHSDPVGRLAFSDPLGRALDDLELALRNTLTFANQGIHAAKRLRPIPPIRHRDAQELAENTEASAAVECANINCRRLVAGTPNDRIRSGRCFACYRYRLRNAGHERPCEEREAS